MEVEQEPTFDRVGAGEGFGTIRVEVEDVNGLTAQDERPVRGGVCADAMGVSRCL